MTPEQTVLAGGTEGGRSPTGVPPAKTGNPGREGGGQQHFPDPAVPENPDRRRFTAEYKLRVLQEADRCRQPGELGALLRREGLYSSHLANWRHLRDQGALPGLGARRRGRKPAPNAALLDENERLPPALAWASPEQPTFRISSPVHPSFSSRRSPRAPLLPRALDADERQVVLDVLHSKPFVDMAPADIYATLLDQGTYYCSIRTMYRILHDANEVRERRSPTRHLQHAKPQLVATAPNQVWS